MAGRVVALMALGAAHVPHLRTSPPRICTPRIYTPRMSISPGTLQFSAFRGYYIELDDGGEVLIEKERVDKGLVMGNRVAFDTEVPPSEPLVKALVEAETLVAAVEEEEAAAALVAAAAAAVVAAEAEAAAAAVAAQEATAAAEVDAERQRAAAAAEQQRQQQQAAEDERCLLDARRTAIADDDAVAFDARLHAGCHAPHALLVLRRDCGEAGCVVRREVPRLHARHIQVP